MWWVDVVGEVRHFWKGGDVLRKFCWRIHHGDCFSPLAYFACCFWNPTPNMPLPKRSGAWLGRWWEAREISVGPLAWGLRPCTGGFILAAASLSDPPSFGSLWWWWCFCSPRAEVECCVRHRIICLQGWPSDKCFFIPAISEGDVASQEPLSSVASAVWPWRTRVRDGSQWTPVQEERLENPVLLPSTPLKTTLLI